MAKTKTTAQKQTKASKAKTVKKYTYTVDLTGVETMEDVALAFAYAKFNANLPLTIGDLDAIKTEVQIDTLVDATDAIIALFPVMCSICTECEHKKKGNGFFDRIKSWFNFKK